MSNGDINMENRMAVPPKIKSRVTMWSSSFVHKRIENRDARRYVHFHVYSPQLKLRVRRQMNEYAKRGLYVQWNMDEPRRLSGSPGAGWNKLVVERQTLCDSTYMQSVVPLPPFMASVPHSRLRSQCRWPSSWWILRWSTAAKDCVTCLRHSPHFLSSLRHLIISLRH